MFLYNYRVDNTKVPAAIVLLVAVFTVPPCFVSREFDFPRDYIRFILLGQYPAEHGIVAPGMSCQFSVKFAPDSLTDYVDKVQVCEIYCRVHCMVILPYISHINNITFIILPDYTYYAIIYVI